MTSDELAVGTYPQFASAGAGRFTGTANPYEPYAGSYMAAVVDTDNAYKRLTRTIDLTRVSAADKPTLRARLLWDTEPGYGHAVVEAHTAGADDWTTLPEAGGATRDAVPTDCEAGFLVGEHPWLKHYLTVAAGGCAATGTTGAWHSLTGASDGWQQVNFDLSAYAGKKADISLSCITDPSTGGHGLLVVDVSLVVGGTATETEGFEASLGAWSVAGPPAGSPAVLKDFSRTRELFTTYGAVTTDRTVLLGFGLEEVVSAADRSALVRKALAALGG